MTTLGDFFLHPRWEKLLSRALARNLTLHRGTLGGNFLLTGAVGQGVTTYGYVETVFAYNLRKNVFTFFCELEDF